MGASAAGASVAAGAAAGAGSAAGNSTGAGAGAGAGAGSSFGASVAGAAAAAGAASSSTGFAVSVAGASFSAGKASSSTGFGSSAAGAGAGAAAAGTHVRSLLSRRKGRMWGYAYEQAPRAQAFRPPWELPRREREQEQRGLEIVLEICPHLDRTGSGCVLTSRLRGCGRFVRLGSFRGRSGGSGRSGRGWK